MSAVVKLEEAAARTLAQDARVVAMRWDIVPWALVLDVDAATSEGAGTDRTRAWLVFSGVAELTIPIVDARLPTGFWIVSSLSVDVVVPGLRDYAGVAHLPEFDGSAPREGHVSKGIKLRAQSLVAVVSTRAAAPDVYGLTYEARNRLASDDDLIQALGA